MQQSLRCNRFTSRASFPDEVTAMANLGMTTLQRSQDVSSGAPESTACGHAVSLQHTPILRIDELHQVVVFSDQRIGLEDRFVLCVVALGTISTIDNQSPQFCKVYT
ncbi:Hypothetical_protein [Hexamita inflata]|uniref:Hypothetical_protein n=1 Tax=Hexamita inflata TaxID=28002 RepID=A0ABP1KPY5_9EUKA